MMSRNAEPRIRMSYPMSRPSTPDSLLPRTPDPLEARLIRGIDLDPSYRWSQVLRFALLVFPGLWMCCSLFFAWQQRHPTALLTGLAWALLATPLLFVLQYLLRGLSSASARLRLRNQQLQHLTRTAHRILDLQEPFGAFLLYREQREDALLLLQGTSANPQDHDAYSQTMMLYGRFRHSKGYPPNALSTQDMGFSLAELSLDQHGAWMMPDRAPSQEYLPPLTQALLASPGYLPSHFQLPLSGHGPHKLRLGQSSLTWLVHGEVHARYDLHELELQLFAFSEHGHKRDKAPQLHPILCIDGPVHTRDEDVYTPLPQLWLAIDWPTPLGLAHLPFVKEAVLEGAISVSAIDTMLLLHHIVHNTDLEIPDLFKVYL